MRRGEVGTTPPARARAGSRYAPGRRDSGRRVTKGNAGGPGNPFAGRVALLRKTLLESVNPQDVREVVEMLVREAKGGSITAAKELLERLLGKPVELDLLQRLDDLE